MSRGMVAIMGGTAIAQMPPTKSRPIARGTESTSSSRT